MENPKNGFDMLDQKLKPGGLMKIALYSRSFRNLLKPSKRTFNSAENKKNTRDIRYARNEIMKKITNDLSIIQRLQIFIQHQNL